MGICNTSPLLNWLVNGLFCVSTRRCTCLQMYFNPALRISAPGNKPASGQYLESITDAQYQPTSGSELLYRLHYGRKPCNRPRAQVVPIRKSARNQHRIHPLQVLRIVPEKRDRLLCNLRNHVVGVVIAIGPRKDQNAKFHASRLPVC